MMVWAQNHKDSYPLPSLVDLSDLTVPLPAEAKDTTANIASLLVFNGFFSTEILISPLEVNRGVRECLSYEYDNPKAAADSARALWDPALSADFTSPTGGNMSYAHMPPSGKRRDFWTSVGGRNFASPVPVIANRGPLTTAGADGVLASDPKSNTLRFFGSSKVWHGNVAFSDNHVDFLTQPMADTAVFKAVKPRADHFFYDEPDDPTGTNAFLGIFIKAGPQPKDFKSLWD
jgi:hypothetical protein